MTPQSASVSVVIPTLGGESLQDTITHLNGGTLAPAEVLVCIPLDYSDRVSSITAPNVRIVKTDCRGQVAQRRTGFVQCVHPLVLQLDDDVELLPDCLAALVDFLERHPRSAVAPKFFDKATGLYKAFLVSSSGRGSWLDAFLFWVVNGSRGYEAGKISRAGVNMGVPEYPADAFGLDWVPGGCMLHRREDLVLSNFYPFPGKAFAEDLFHCAILAQHGVKLHRCGSAKCLVDFSSSASRSLFRTLKDYREYASRMRLFVRERRGSVSRLYAYLVLNALKIAANKLS